MRPVPARACLPWTRDELRFAYTQGYLSAEEFNVVRAAANPPPGDYREMGECAGGATAPAPNPGPEWPDGLPPRSGPMVKGSPVAARA